MQMDQDLFRAILIVVESIPPKRIYRREKLYKEILSLFDEKDTNRIDEHIKIGIEAGFIEGHLRNRGRGEFRLEYVERLTYSGHEYLAKVRDETTWNNVKTQIKEKGLNVSIDIIKRIAEKYIQKKIGE